VEAKDPLIHVSLFGVRELSDITTQMFEKAHPVLGGKAVKLINRVGSKLGGFAGLSLDPKENAALLESMALNLKDRILVFDDLERSPLPLVEVMGFINRFVKHDKLRVIVVASENDIPEGQREEYKGRKEKLVGKTIKVGSDPAEVLDVFTKRMKTSAVLKAIADNRERLLTTFAASGRPNFRSLRAVLLDYERIVTLVDPRLSASDDAMGQLLLNMIALGVEFRSNALDDNALRNLQTDIRLRLKFGASPKPDNNAQKRRRISARAMSMSPSTIRSFAPIISPTSSPAAPSISAKSPRSHPGHRCCRMLPAVPSLQPRRSPQRCAVRHSGNMRSLPR